MTDDHDSAPPPPPSPPTRPCPICGKPAIAELRPFCSKRCRDVDLSRWFKEVYVIPVEEDGEDSGGEQDG